MTTTPLTDRAILDRLAQACGRKADLVTEWLSVFAAYQDGLAIDPVMSEDERDYYDSVLTEISKEILSVREEITDLRTRLNIW